MSLESHNSNFFFIQNRAVTAFDGSRQATGGLSDGNFTTMRSILNCDGTDEATWTRDSCILYPLTHRVGIAK